MTEVEHNKIILLLTAAKEMIEINRPIPAWNFIKEAIEDIKAMQ